jgi:hypothetical protein
MEVNGHFHAPGALLVSRKVYSNLGYALWFCTCTSLHMITIYWRYRSFVTILIPLRASKGQVWRPIAVLRKGSLYWEHSHIEVIGPHSRKSACSEICMWSWKENGADVKIKIKNHAHLLSGYLFILWVTLRCCHYLDYTASADRMNDDFEWTGKEVVVPK